MFCFPINENFGQPSPNFDDLADSNYENRQLVVTYASFDRRYLVNMHYRLEDLSMEVIKNWANLFFKNNFSCFDKLRKDLKEEAMPPEHIIELYGSDSNFLNFVRNIYFLSESEILECLDDYFLGNKIDETDC